MKVVAFNGSARKDGNTAMMINALFEPLNKRGIATEMVQLAGEHLRGCVACYQCFKQKDGHCVVSTDCVNECIDKMMEADAIVLASPAYFADVTANIKALIERAGMSSRANNDQFKRKLGAAIVTRRRGGAIHTFNSLNHFFTIGQMIIVGSSYWNIGAGLDKGDVAEDEEGLATMHTLGKNMAWLLGKIHG